MDIFIPELAIVLACCFDIWQPLSDQLVWRESLETQPALLCQVEVAVIRDVAEHARGNDVIGILAAGIVLG